MTPNQTRQTHLIRLLLITPDPETPLATAFDADRLFHSFVRQTITRDDLQEFRPDVVVIASSEEQRLSEVFQSLKSMSWAPSFITVGDIHVTDLRSLISYPRAHTLPTDAAPMEVVSLALRVKMEAALEPQTDTNGQCWAVTGAVGGAGASLIAIEIAYQLMKRTKNAPSVCLIDLNFEDGSLATYLDLSPGLDVSVMCAAPERIDASLLDAFVSEHESGLKLLAAPRGARFKAKISPDVILRLLEISCEMYDYIVVDIPRWRQPWTEALAQGADKFLVVSELTVPALRAARNLCADLEVISRNVLEPTIILNRMAKRMFGHSISVDKAETALGRKALASVSSDWDAAQAAVNMGMPISMANPGAKMAKDITGIIDKLSGTAKAKKEKEAA
ncbi:MAG: hypothetical protein CMK09_01020 [Ponticaulis sp.]|nr:hypothetical protein [Ponticaulis sp.]|tara:strand:+ start:7718 stop:8890 length:1173 start_codon:yes stop_codon:yes gene_type:complete